MYEDGPGPGTATWQESITLALVLAGPVPDIRITSADGLEILLVRVDSPPPVFASVFTTPHIQARDVIEHVLDEEAWLAALTDALEPDGRLEVRVPFEGPLAWLDALNLYRYLVDILHRGHKPPATKPAGWHRHYRVDEIETLLSGCGLQPGPVHRSGGWRAEVRTLLRLVRGDLLAGDPDAMRRVIASLPPAPARGHLVPRLLPGALITVTGRKTSLRRN